MNDNPFEVLRLDPSATEEEIVRQAGRLRQRAANEATQNALRQAVQALTARAEDRRLFALLTHPAPRPSEPALERFVAAFRRPLTPSRSAEPCPVLDIEEFKTILYAFDIAELELPTLTFEPLASDETPDEIERQTMEAMWQNMPFDPGA
jgi:hypothetical protein